jgi:glucose/arabinose dehydrogenase
MKHTLLLIITVLAIILLGIIGTFFFVFWSGLKPAVLPPVTPPTLEDMVTTAVAEGYYRTVHGLTIPVGFELRVLTEAVPNARNMIIGPQGEIIVSQTKSGTISSVDRETGVVTELVRGLNNPHGLLLDLDDPFRMYIAEENKLSAIRLYSGTDSYEEILALPAGGRHVTRSLIYTAAGEMLISIGSTCDTCEEANPLHGTIQRVNLITKTLEPYATGLRNAVFMTLHELDGSLWVTEMGRDMLGNDLPPDELNRIEEGAWYGWPWYYGQNVFDETFASGRAPGITIEPTPATIDLPAHVAPLGLDTVPESGWPEDYWYDLIVAYHGSWNRTPPIGYEVVRHQFDSNMKYLGVAPLISGWLTSNNRSTGRPVDIVTLPGGIMYISDDTGGRIYELRYVGERESAGDDTEELPYINNVSTITAATTELTGYALGTWYFEADFPIEVLDSNNVVVDTLIATALSDWMTTSSVPFSVPFQASLYSGQTISFILKKDNPSGLPEFDASVTIPNIYIP